MKVAVYTGTRNIYKDMLPSIKSLLIHSDVDKIYLLIEDNIFPYELPKEVECINISDQKFFNPSGPNFNSSWTYIILIRAALSKIFPQYDKILSLDVDTIINQNISELWDMDLTNYYLAAVSEPCKSSENFISINMGVTLINLKKMRDDHKDDEIIQKLNEKYYDYPEQDCISELCQGHIFELPPNYNINNWADLDKVDERIIQHFAATKGWQNLPLVKKYRDIPFEKIIRNQNDEIKIDIIIPAYNDIEGLRRTLKSVYPASQFSFFTVTVVNDASTEDYSEVEKEYPKVKFVHLKENGGPGRARNIGRRETSNPYLMFVDCGDIIFSQWSFCEIIETIHYNKSLDIYQWPWVNGEWYTVSAENSVCTPGLVYKREFLDLYNIWYCEEPSGSYSNEDIGFNHTCKAILKHIETYDDSKHYEFFETPIYKMVYDKNSLTHRGNSYMLVKQIPGLVTNATHCIHQLEANEISIEAILGPLNVFMVQLYRDYMSCARRRPDLINEHWETIRHFYNTIYSKYENEELNLMYQNLAVSARIKDLQKVCSKRINLKRFLRALQENNKQLFDF